MHAIKNALARRLKLACSKVKAFQKGRDHGCFPHPSSIYLKRIKKFMGIKRADSKWFI